MRRRYIHNTILSSKLLSGADKQECLSLACFSVIVLSNILAYWTHSQVTKKIMGSKYSPRLLVILSDTKQC
jgi:hypothetical protein